MNARFDLYAKIFVRGIDQVEAKELLARDFRGEFDVNSMHLDGFVVEARKNTDAGKGPVEDFLFWPIIVELDADPESGLDLLISSTSRVLKMFWSSDLQAIAACDFENRLPWRGGLDLYFSICATKGASPLE
ncbi:hypothetical protein [Nocardiopsis alba]|uniref:Uncharacterized protein n=1 Tax=Nocardiopsis alba (strain ATCC BAA-2165 / BE74) TaxID=1205910 RepID=J7LAV4_NOCAA|nr:hypothetical protein [Nocardiopsis alba]AFR10798.1 hypothetical protein B005_2239 [Nocardiopsis alba ATCC BAA-2165]